MTTIQSTIDLPRGWLKMYWVKDEAEALQIAQDAQGKSVYFFRSRIVDGCYLFVKVEEEQ